MNLIIENIKKEKEYAELLRTAARQVTAHRPVPFLMSGLSEPARDAMYGALIEDAPSIGLSSVVIVVPDEKEAVRLRSVLCDSGIDALLYRARDFVFYPITSSHEYEHERLGVLSALLNTKPGSCTAVVTTPDAVLQFTVPRSVLAGSSRRIKIGERLPLGELVPFLDTLGFIRVDMVDGEGQYAVRGGILDLFPPGCEDPIRCEYFDEEIETIHSFDLMTQRRIAPLDWFDLTASREVLISPDRRRALLEHLRMRRKNGKGKINEAELDAEIDTLVTERELLAADKYISFVYPERECLLDYAADGMMIRQDSAGIGETLKAFEWRMQQTVEELLSAGSVDPKFADYCHWQEDFSASEDKIVTLMTESFAGQYMKGKLSGLFSIQNRQLPSYADDSALLMERVSFYHRAQYRVAVLCENDAMGRTLCSMLEEQSIPSFLCGMNEHESCDPPAGVVAVIAGPPQNGLELVGSKFVCLSACQITTNRNRARAPRFIRDKQKKKSSQERILSYADLTVGDYVVHANHGIGQYLGLQNLTVDGVTREFVKIKYDGKDVLYLPCNQLDMVSKYIGATGEDGTVKLSKMGGAEWVKTRTRVKAAAKEMAKELIQLYAQRQRRPGFAFEPDDELQREFESGFEFEETEGQLTAIREIKSDMEKRWPMDRLLCGDVGFGKTEVALRAAFKAVNSSKQVAILVPTTILALQHYQTILSRMRGFPVSVEMLSRFRTPKQQAESIRRIKRGEADIVIGTHRLLSKDVEFRDLGLVIIDEEQRFGVAHKEKLKQLSQNVDVLTLTATPIPRTLNMAMSGIRDMSILEEAPQDRVPVQTYVLEYDELILTEAIRRELQRGGQVFYLHNDIESLERVAAGIVDKIPQARVVTAHGQMDKEQLSDIWRMLVEGQIDVLVCTTIIESGVDVPNVNTLIIDNADRIGLSQLHQIRGRVGRSSRRAYAYLTYPRGKALTEVAEKRLSAIRDFTEFGSGFKIALRDLEIRGAGNILGAEQHGHIASVGYDLYIRLLNEAILEEKGEAPARTVECQVDFNVNAYIPETYIRASNQRIDAYKKISYIESEADRADIRDELEDRYGPIPASVGNLFSVSLIRSLGGKCGFLKIEQKSGSVIFRPEKLDAAAWTKLAGEYRGRLLLNSGTPPYACYRIRPGDEVLSMVCTILTRYAALIASEKEAQSSKKEDETI